MSENKVYASSDTFERLGWIVDYVPDRAKTDVLIITREDLLKRGQALPPDQREEPLEKEPEDLALMRSGLKAWFNELAQKHGLPTQAPILNSDIATLQIAGNAYDYNASAFPFDFDDDGKTDFGIIVTSDLNYTPSESAADITGFPAQYMPENVGTTVENQAMEIWHEATHLSQPPKLLFDPRTGYANMPLPFEAHADSGAIDTFLQAIDDGHALNHGFIQNHIDQRLVGSLGAPGADMDFIHFGGIIPAFFGSEVGTASHTTHIIINDKGELPGPDGLLKDGNNFIQENWGMVTANTAINALLGLDYTMNTMVSEFRENDKLSEQSTAYLGENDLPTAMTSGFVQMDIGQKIAGENPMMALAAGKVLMEKGLLSADHPEGEYIKKIQQFFEKRGDVLTQAPEFLEAKAHYSELLDTYMQQEQTAEPVYGFVTGVEEHAALWVEKDSERYEEYMKQGGTFYTAEEYDALSQPQPNENIPSDSPQDFSNLVGKGTVKYDLPSLAGVDGKFTTATANTGPDSLEVLAKTPEELKPDITATAYKQG